VDMDRSGRIRDPSELTAAHVPEQLYWARRAASATGQLLEPGMSALFANPDADRIEYSRALVSGFTEAGRSRSPEAAANVRLNAVGKVQH